MKVILTQDVKGQGKKNQIIDVSDGYAKNFLLPKKLAVPADAKTLNEAKNKEASIQHKIEVEKEEARQIAEKLNSITLTVKTGAGQDGKLYGAITAKDIAEKLEAEHKIVIDKRKIQISEPIKTYGAYKLEVKLYTSEITGTVNLIVTEK